MTVTAIIAGTGFERLGELELEHRIHARSPWGSPSAPIEAGRLGGSPVLFLSRHGHRHELAPHEIDYRANIDALVTAGAEQVLAVYTVGGIAPALTPGSLVVPHQIVDYTWGRAHSFSRLGEVIHVDFSDPFDAELGRALAAGLRAGSAADEPPVVEGGVYGATQGPRLESAAEIDRLDRDGCTVVGMTAMPEVALARERGLRIAGVCLVVNPAAGRGAISLPEMEKVAAAGRGRILRGLARALSGA